MALNLTGTTDFKDFAKSLNIGTNDYINFTKNKIQSNTIFDNPVNPFQNLGTTSTTQVSEIDYSIAKDLPILNETTPENKFANEYLKKASEQQELSKKLSIASGVSNIFSAVDTYNQVKNTKYQYEQQKRVMDLNLKNTESLLLENYKQTMSDIDATMAAKNVDLSSQGLVNMKRKGLMNIGEDIALQNQQNDLNKAALDLQYAYQKSQAKTNMTNSILSNAFSIGMNLGWL